MIYILKNGIYILSGFSLKHKVIWAGNIETQKVAIVSQMSDAIWP